VEQLDSPLASQHPAVSETPETLVALLSRQAAARPDKLAYGMLDDALDIEHSMTFGELGATTAVLSQALLQQARPGDRVLLAYNNGVDAIQAFWGCIAAGLIPVPAPAPESGHSRVALGRITGIATDAKILLALTSDDIVEQAREQADELQWCTVSELLAGPQKNADVAALSCKQGPDTVAYLQYTSGSTSEPRGVEITHGAVLAQCLALDRAVTVDHDRDCGLIWLPWSHDYGLLHALILPVYEGVSSYLMPTLSFMRRPLRWLSAIDKYRITHTGAPNFAFAACTQALTRNRTWSGQLDSLRVASCGAEPIRRDTLEAFTSAFAPHGLAASALAPSYGLAEAVLVVTLSRSGPQYLQVDSRALERNRVAEASGADSAASEFVSCGEPLPGFDVRIVDPVDCAQCADGEVGEVWVSGPSIGRGYWANAAASETTFAASLANDSRGLFLRTGDLGFLHQGELYITGRRKDLLVINGRNVYPQDLEQTAETGHAAVRAAGVIAIGVANETGHESVVLLVECKGRPAPEIVAEITAALRQSVAADHEIEVLEVVALRSGSLPRTSSGKPQRSAARQLYLDGDFADRRLAELEPAASAASPHMPEATLQRVLAIWSEVLAVPAPQASDDFFAQGGDSLLATQIVSRLNAQLHIELPVRAVFEAPSPRGLARLADAAEPVMTQDQSANLNEVSQSKKEQRLSFTQERMWFMHQLAPDSSAYNVPLALRLRGVLNTHALHQAVQWVAQRHQVLQTGFEHTPDGPRACIAPPSQMPRVEEIDLRSDVVPTPATIESTLSWLTKQPFNLDQPPLLRLSLVRLSDEDAILLCVMHHIIGDQWSCAVLGRELALAYGAALKNTSPAVPELPSQYADFAHWQRDWFHGTRKETQLSYWRKHLGGLEPLHLNEDFPRPTQQQFRGATVSRKLDGRRLESLNQLAAANGASLSMVMIAALKTLLMRHTGATDIAIGVPVANRHHLRTENLIGSFVNTLVFRTDLSGSPDFNEALRRVREVSLDAYTHQDMPFEALVRELDLPHDTSHSPLFDVMFNMINVPARGVEFPGLSWSRHDFDRGAAQFDLAVSVDALYEPQVMFEYATGLFANDTIERMVDHYMRILDAVIADAATPLTDIALLSAADQQSLQQWGQGRAGDVSQPAPMVYEQIAAQACATPSAVAVTAGGISSSYGQLDAGARQLAAELRERGIGRGSTVGLCLPRSRHLPAVLLGVMRSGAAFVPLDPAYPRDRLLFQAHDAAIDLLIAEEQTARYLDWPAADTCFLDKDAAHIAKHPTAPVTPDATLDAGPDDPAYVIYTSGSTGTPKGVVVPHRALTNFLSSMREQPGLTADDTLLAVTTLGFDIALLELLLPLTIGASVVIAADIEAGDGEALAALLDQHDISVMQATPSRWRMLFGVGWQGKRDLRALVGGEPLAPDLAQQLCAACCEVWNMYGPTETTIWSSCWKLPNVAIEPVSLGQPIAQTTLQVLDERGQQCPIGVPGELCIGGQGLALGYRNQQSLTDQQFVSSGARAVFPGIAIYRTGDRARWRHDGRLLHLGRSDSQVKLRGYRIEPGEIESRLTSHPSVAQALVLVDQRASDEQQLIAYIVGAASTTVYKPDELRAHLRQWLPEHMVPKNFQRLESIPTLANGKLDRRALPAPVQSDFARGERDDTPQTRSQSELLSIWQAVLQRRDFGIHDNFFDVGGHSLLAVNMVQKIAQDLQLDCPLRLLFQHPTVAELDAALQSGHAGLHDNTAVQLLANGTVGTLFCLSGTQQYRELASYLPAHSRVFGLLSAAEAELLEKGTRLPEISELAATYLQTIRRLQPRGPYRLAGFSIGGVIAFEVAQQLRASGQQVELLALLDSGAPGFSAGHVKRWLRKRAVQIWRNGPDYARRLWAKPAADQPGESNKVNALVYPEYVRVMRSYEASQWAGSLLFLQAEDDPVQEPGYGWSSHVREMVVERVPGQHMDMLQGASARYVAECLSRQFDKV